MAGLVVAVLVLFIHLRPCQGGPPSSNLSSREVVPFLVVGRCSPELSAPNPKQIKRHILRPERTRISRHAALDMAACGAFRKESRMKFANATNLDRKSGVA
jgi:hypothetical protein